MCVGSCIDLTGNVEGIYSEKCEHKTPCFMNIVPLYEMFFVNGCFDSVFACWFLSVEYLADLQGRGGDDPGVYWDFYGSSVCGKQTSPFCIMCVFPNVWG